MAALFKGGEFYFKYLQAAQRTETNTYLFRKPVRIPYTRYRSDLPLVGNIFTPYNSCGIIYDVLLSAGSNGYAAVSLPFPQYT